MGLETATLASITAATSVTSAVYGISQNIQQRKAQERAQDVQRANNKMQQMEEQRQRIREERIRRARIVQSAENTGTQGSSGEAGALGSLATKMNVGTGFNLSAIDLGIQASTAAQQAADAAGSARVASTLGSFAPTAFNLSASIFAPSSTNIDFPMSDGTKPVGSRMGVYE